MDASQKQKLETKIPEPVSSVRKEGPPTINHEPYITPSEVEPVLHPEVVSAGVETVNHSPELPKDVEKLGLTHSPEAAKPATEPSGIVKLPLTEEVAEQIISDQKHDSAIAEHTEGIYRTNSVYGLAVLVRKIFSKMHGRLLGK
jgi:hypothetical protein